MDESKFNNVIVLKNWGIEFLLYETFSVAAWMLQMKAGHSTSLHSHPGKLTGYIVIEGEIELQFLNDSQKRKALDKAVIQSYVPHKTIAITDCKLIEVECPKDHENLIRFEDEYGRAGQSYETADRHIPKNEKTPYLAPGTTQELSPGVFIRSERITPGEPFLAWLAAIPARAAIAVMGGELVDRSGRRAVVPGHVIWEKDLKRISDLLEPSGPMDVLTVWDARPNTI